MFVVVMMTKWYIGQPMWENPHAPPRFSAHTTGKDGGVLSAASQKRVINLKRYHALQCWQSIISVWHVSCVFLLVAQCLFKDVCEGCGGKRGKTLRRRCVEMLWHIGTGSVVLTAASYLSTVFFLYFYVVFVCFLISIFYFSVNILFNFQDL